MREMSDMTERDERARWERCVKEIRERESERCGRERLRDAGERGREGEGEIWVFSVFVLICLRGTVFCLSGRLLNLI